MNGTKAVTFKEAFCAKFDCRPQDYVPKMLSRAFYPHARPIGHVLLALNTPSAQEARYAVESLAEAEDLRDINKIMDDYRYRLRERNISSLVRSFKIRLSGKRVLNIYMRTQEARATTRV